MFKLLPILFVLFVTIQLSTQSLSKDEWLAQKLKLKLEQLNDKTESNQGNQEKKVIICGSEFLPDKCTDKPLQNKIAKLVRSIELPLTNLFDTIKKLPVQLISSNDNNTTEVADELRKLSEISTPVYESKLIKCDSNSTIAIVKAILTNKDTSKCPISKFISVSKDEWCDERIKTTEIAKKLCDGKNECQIELSTQFNDICECSLQKYLDLSYMCINKESESETTNERSARNKRLIRLRYRIFPREQELDRVIRRRPGFGLGGLYGGFGGLGGLYGGFGGGLYGGFGLYDNYYDDYLDDYYEYYEEYDDDYYPGGFHGRRRPNVRGRGRENDNFRELPDIVYQDNARDARLPRD